MFHLYIAKPSKTSQRASYSIYGHQEDSPYRQNGAMLADMTTIDIARMTPAERLDLIGRLWDSLEPEKVVLSTAQEAELTRRMTTFERDLKTAVPWETIDEDFIRRT